MSSSPLWQAWAQQMGRQHARRRCGICRMPVVDVRSELDARCCEQCAEGNVDLRGAAVAARA